MNNSQKKIYGLIGYPLGHSFSQNYFNQKFEAEGIDAEYINFELPDIGDLMEVFAENPGLSGLNVTIPYKELVIPNMDSMDGTAAEIGAVNVIKIRRDNAGNFSLKGYNSDIVGFTDSISPMLKPYHKKALILGTGGASKAVDLGLRNLGLITRKVSRSKKENALTYSELTPEIMSDYTVIVNTTPLGMYPHMDECPDIPYDLLTSKHLCYDLLYNPDVTLFMRKSAEHGAEVKNGLEMLLLQAFESWRIWND
ncbi:MAG: shikimate dehydrogenase [Muribaculaceae bacterium]|nr:shikimate dehydrogenase [Muribaculaceae bacterium]